MGIYDSSNYAPSKKVLLEIEKMRREGRLPQSAADYIAGQIELIGRQRGDGQIPRRDFEKLLNWVKTGTTDPISYSKAEEIKKRLLEPGPGIRKVGK